MKTLICDLCNSDERVLTYTISNKSINQKFDNTIDQMWTNSFYQPSKPLEICNKCADNIHNDYSSLLIKHGLDKYV